MRKALVAANPVEARDLMELHNRAFEAIRSYLAAIHSPGSEREALDCAEVLEKALRPLIMVKPRGVRVEKALEPSLPTLIGDRRRLTQLFQNLIVNAFEAMPDGGVLTMRAQNLGPQVAGPRAGVRRGVRISIEDTGPGMTDGELRRAFDPGYTTKESGSGYGLAVAGQVAREHGGRVWLERTDERGTRAVVELPEEPQPEAAAERLRLRPIMFEDWRRLIHTELDPIQPTDGSVQRGSSGPAGEAAAP
jgi:signal transduction histidine kinase